MRINVPDCQSDSSINDFAMLIRRERTKELSRKSRIAAEIHWDAMAGMNGLFQRTMGGGEAYPLTKKIK